MCVNAIWYSLTDQDLLNSLQIEFTNGFKTPPIKSAKLEIDPKTGSVEGAHRLAINPNIRIRKIGLEVYDCDHYTGIRLYGRDRKPMLEKIWKVSSKGMWLYKTLPCKSELCGIGATMSSVDTYIIQLGF